MKLLHEAGTDVSRASPPVFFISSCLRVTLARLAGDGVLNRYPECDMSVSTDNWALYKAAFTGSL